MVATKQQPAPSRMRLDALVKGKQKEPISVLLFGVEGCGKSTFGSDAPKPIFIDGEGGSGHLDVARFPKPETWTDVLDAIRTLTTDRHEYETLVIDTLDWLEPLLWDFICKRDGQANVEAYGYGKGYQTALDEWRVFLADLERLQAKRGMHVVMLAHCWIRTFKNPEASDFDRWEMKLNAKAAGLLKEWPKACLFANYETIAATDNKKRVRGVSTGARLIHTQRTAAYDAKNRYSLPESMPLSWAEFFAGVQGGQVAEPAVLAEEIKRKASGLGDVEKKKVLDALDKAGLDAVKLAKINSYANAKVNELETANG